MDDDMSAPQPDDVGWMAKALAAMGVALTGLATWAWQHTHSRIKDVDMKTDGKASTEEVERHRDHITKLFDKIEELSDKTEVRFTVIESRASDRHVELLKAIHESRNKR